MAKDFPTTNWRGFRAEFLSDEISTPVFSEAAQFVGMAGAI